MIKNGSVRKRGNKWYYSFDIGKIDGKRKRIEKVCKNATTKSSALLELAEAIKLYESGGIPSNSPEITVTDFAKLWIDNYVNVAVNPTTRRGYIVAINQFADEYGIYKLKTITRLTAQDFVNKLHEKGLKYSTIMGKMVIIHNAFEYAMTSLNLFQVNPITKYKIPKPISREKTVNYAYTEKEALKILKYFKDKGYHSHYISCLIAYKTGMREGEIFGLLPEDVDLTKGVIYVKNNLQICVKYIESRYLLKAPKTESSKREIVIDEELIAELKKYNKYRTKNKLKYGEHYKKLYLNEHSEVVERKTKEQIEFFICQENGRFMVSTTFCDVMQVAGKRLGFKVTMHSFRHTHATMLIENGLNIKAVQSRLGHSNVKTTLNIYAETTEKSQEQTKEILKNIKLPTSAQM